MKGAPKNVAASVRARLLHRAQERREDFQLVLTRYANERLLHRLSVSPHASQFILKGAALFTVWTGRAHRATRDLDFLGFGDSTLARFGRVFDEILRLVVPDDGVSFDVDSLAVGPIREEQAYGGVRAVFFARIAGARVRMQVDVGFGEAITPGAEVVEFPALLDFPPPKLRAYPRETVVAEKVEAMVKLGMANSRMKDFFDVVVLSETFDFDGVVLARAIGATFDRRGTPLPEALPVALTPAFSLDAAKQSQWTAFLRKSGATGERRDLATIVAAATTFLEKPLQGARSASPWTASWQKPGPWLTK